MAKACIYLCHRCFYGFGEFGEHVAYITRLLWFVSF